MFEACVQTADVTATQTLKPTFVSAVTLDEISLLCYTKPLSFCFAHDRELMSVLHAVFTGGTSAVGYDFAPYAPQSAHQLIHGCFW